VILFSDILTPLSGMNIPFDIVKGKGPVIFDPVHSASQVDEVREFIPEDSVPYVGEALTILRKEVRVSYILPLHPCFIISIHTYFYCWIKVKPVCCVKYHKAAGKFFRFIWVIKHSAFCGCLLVVTNDWRRGSFGSRLMREHLT
jgi:hypothetical protein